MPDFLMLRALRPLRPLRALPRWSVLLLVAVALRALTFGNPIVHVDEEFYFTTAHAMLRGAVPYLDIWDRKPVGLFLLYVPAAALGLPLGIWAYQAMALASVVATALLIAHLAEQAGWARGALPAALAYLLWLNLLEGEGGQTPVFYNLLMVAAASLVAPRPDDAGTPGRRLRYGIAAFALVGCALQIKYSVLFEGAYFGLWWLWRERRLGRRRWQALALAALLAALAVLPTLAAWGWYAAHGAGDAFVYANFVSIGQRVADPLIDQLLNLLIIVLVISPLLAMVLLTARLPRTTGPTATMRGWLFGWGAVAALGLLGFGAYFDHYALPLLVPLCAIAAGFFAEHRGAKRMLLPLFALLFVGSQAILVAKLHGRGTPAQFAALTRAIGRDAGADRGCLYVFSGTSMFYTYADRCTLTRYLFPTHLDRLRERGAIGVDQQAEIARIFRARPQVVVVRQPFPGERPDMRALALRLLAPDYGLRASLPLGNDLIAVYARKRVPPALRRASTSP